MYRKRKRVPLRRDRGPRLPDQTLYKRKEINVCTVNDAERIFIRTWCIKRNLEDLYAIQALTYWVRVKASLVVSFLVRQENRELYMVICIHLALKWHGYDEVFKCDFYRDLKEIYPQIRCCEHQEMEVEILRELQWELG